MDTDGDNQIRLTFHEQDDNSPVWSPDGRQIAFESRRDGNKEIYVMDADGGNQRNLTQHPAIDGSPDWHPDSTRIAFHRGREGDANIYTMDADGENVKQVTRLELAINPKWSPDGRWIAFDWWANPPGIYAIEPDTTLLCRISKPVFDMPMFFPVPMFVAGWSSDGSKVMYAAPIANAHNDLVLHSPRTDTERWLNGRRCLYLKDLTARLSGALMRDLYSLHMRHLTTRISTVTGSIIKH